MQARGAHESKKAVANIVCLITYIADVRQIPNAIPEFLAALENSKQTPHKSLPTSPNSTIRADRRYHTDNNGTPLHMIYEAMHFKTQVFQTIHC